MNGLPTKHACGMRDARHVPVLLIAIALCVVSCRAPDAIRVVPVGEGWAATSVNAVIFRRNAVVSHADTQYVAYYDAEGRVVLARRTLGSRRWEVRTTPYSGNVRDAHNTISIMVDGDGYLHMAWDHHGDSLRYARSTAPGSLDLTDKMPMTEHKEDNVTYPEFYRLADGGLLFFYRDGASGRGNVMINHYDLASRTWTTRQDAFIDGEGERNAYWQVFVDAQDVVHLSWVWRESPDVATNHDIAYARSTDGGRTWQRSDGAPYRLPVTADNAEYAIRIPQNRELINTTSMFADEQSRPFIATYWRPEGSDIPQYHLVFHDGRDWQSVQVGNRSQPFSLSGAGTKRIPICRPQIVSSRNGTVIMLFRDAESGGRISAAISANPASGDWHVVDLTDGTVGMWEPTYDTELWKRSNVLHLFVQRVGQGDGERMEELPPQEVSILEWIPQ